MKYITGYLWQGNEESKQLQLNEKECVLLQQILCGRTAIVLACVCDGAELGSYLTGQMRSLLQKYVRELAGGKRKGGNTKQILEAALKQIRQDMDGYLQSKRKQNDTEDERINFSAILIVGQDFWLLQGGSCESYFFNRRFQRTHCRRMGAEFCASWQVVEGSLEKGVGMLLVSKSFWNSVNCDTWKECLAVQDITREEQIERRLKELAGESSRKGYKGECAAVYIKSV